MSEHHMHTWPTALIAALVAILAAAGPCCWIGYGLIDRGHRRLGQLVLGSGIAAVAIALLILLGGK